MEARELGSLENKVMEIIWQAGQSSVRDVLSALSGKKKIAYTTVATIIQRLHDKGLLVRRRSENTYIYSPKLSREGYAKNVASSFVKKFVTSFGDDAIASFAQSVDKLPKEKRDYFLAVLKTKTKK